VPEVAGLMELSLCMIVKNEEAVLERCLSCVKDVADEIVIVDTGSKDSTRTIALSFTPMVFEFPWVDDFSKARNFAFSKATKDYIMWLDADDVITSEAALQLKALKENLDPAVDMVLMPYHVAFDTQGKPSLTYERERIVRRAAGYQWVGAIHEVIPPDGQIVHADIPVLHQKIGPGDPDRNLRIFEKMKSTGQTLSPREEYYYARELMFHQRWDEAIRAMEEYLNADLGWQENMISACTDLSDCYAAVGKKQESLASLFRSVRYDKPRAEVCCQIGRHFFDEGNFFIASFWYELAAFGNLPRPVGGFIQPDCYNYIPYMQLCVCYHRMGDVNKAMELNTMAGIIKPGDASYLYNKAFFESLTGESAGND
jgi:glycosyltransferase involved in cell wall biosynthesis